MSDKDWPLVRRWKTRDVFGLEQTAASERTQNLQPRTKTADHVVPSVVRFVPSAAGSVCSTFLECLVPPSCDFPSSNWARPLLATRARPFSSRERAANSVTCGRSRTALPPRGFPRCR